MKELAVMDEITFVKMHGAGNDFIIIDDRAERLALSRGAIASLCARRRGIGADGLIVLRASASADFAMRYYNSDGGEADLCGNGARCAAAFAHASGIAPISMRFETASGLVEAEMLTDAVRLGIGDVRDLRLNVELEALDFIAHYGVCGVPHAVILDGGFGSLPTDEFVRVARAVRHDPVFGPAGANVNAVSLRAPNQFSYRTYERGVEGETLACGTGAVVASVVLAHLGAVSSPVRCETSGGDLLEVAFVATERGATQCRLTGPVAVVFRGTVDLDGHRCL
jgi:diaminopimelate epimerase